MKFSTAAIFAMFGLVSFAGCASSEQMAPVGPLLSHPGLVRSPEEAKRIERSLTDQDIARLLDADIRAKLPSAVALAKIRCSSYSDSLEYESIDTAEIDSWNKAVADQPLLRGVLPLTFIGLPRTGEPLWALREAAARMHCELLLVYVQTDRYVDNMNDAAVLYWTIAGLWLVPGNQMEHRTVMQAALMDCRTGAILGTATGDCHEKRLYPAAFESQRRGELEHITPARALEDLQAGLGRLMTQISAQAVATRPGV